METLRPDVLVVAAVFVHVFLQQILRNALRERHARNLCTLLGLREAGDGDHLVVLARQEVVHSVSRSRVNNTGSRVFGDVERADDHVLSASDMGEGSQRIEERMLIAASLQRESREAIEKDLEGGVKEGLQGRDLVLHDDEAGRWCSQGERVLTRRGDVLNHRILRVGIHAESDV